MNGDPIDCPKTPNEAQIELKSIPPHIEFVDLKDKKYFLVIIFKDMVAKQEERLLKQEKCQMQIHLI